MFDDHITQTAAAIDELATKLGTGFLEVSSALERGSIISSQEKNQVLQELDESISSPLLCEYCADYLNPNSYYKLIDGPGARKKSCTRCANNVSRRNSFKNRKM